MQGSGGSRGRRGYAPDFKQYALSRLDSGEASLRQLAKELEVSVPTLIKWRKEQLVAEKSRPAAANVSAQRHSPDAPKSELERLREEVEQLKQERDRLRQGIAILAGLNYKVSQ
jgi:transposase-like protein